MEIEPSVCPDGGFAVNPRALARAFWKFTFVVPRNVSVVPPEAVALLLRRMALVVPNEIATPVAVAVALLPMVMVVPLTMLAIVLPPGMPGPLTARPTARVPVPFRPEMELEPAVVLPLSP